MTLKHDLIILAVGTVAALAAPFTIYAWFFVLGGY